MANSKTLTLVVAMDRHGAIGRAGGLPWHLPGDLKHFKRTTLGHTIIMGRKTFDEVGKPLPGRQNIVLSRSLARTPAGVQWAATLADALALAESSEVMIIGGGEIYRRTLAQASRLVVTHVDAAVSGADTWFPDLDRRRWLGQLVAAQSRDDRHEYAFEVRDYRLRWDADGRLCRVPRPGGVPVRLARAQYQALRRALLDRIPRRSPGRTLASVLDEISQQTPREPAGLRWRALRVKLELEAAGQLRRLPGSGRQRLVRCD